jgi:hypothetical protein
MFNHLIVISVFIIGYCIGRKIEQTISYHMLTDDAVREAQDIINSNKLINDDTIN